MVINLEEPYSSLYRKGYLRISKDGRKRVDLFNSNTDRTTISYARYVMSVSLGCVLSKDYEVDHIDRDKNNDDISNLQVLSVEEHRRKNSKEMKTGRAFTELICNNCGKLFKRESRAVKYRNHYCDNFCKWSKQKQEGMDESFKSALEFYASNCDKVGKEFGVQAISERFGVSSKRMYKYIKKHSIGET